MSNEKPALVILAAGMASRYGGNKQIEAFGPNGEIIMEYSIFDAIKAGFGKIIFIIREEFADQFKAAFEPKLNGKVATAYVYQHLSAFAGAIEIPAERTKPFGTQHALLCAKEELDRPFAVINADDFYGADAFEKAYQFLTEEVADNHYACIAYILKNTLSENGAVTRGEIITDENQNLNGIIERKEIAYKAGKAITTVEGQEMELPLNTNVSMNFFCFTPAFVQWSEEQYIKFLHENSSDLKAEFLIPEVVDKLIKQGLATFKLITTNAKWFGVTFKEDAPIVRQQLLQLTNNGDYPNSLW